MGRYRNARRSAYAALCRCTVWCAKGPVASVTGERHGVSGRTGGGIMVQKQLGVEAPTWGTLPCMCNVHTTPQALKTTTYGSLCVRTNLPLHATPQSRRWGPCASAGASGHGWTSSTLQHRPGHLRNHPPLPAQPIPCSTVWHQGATVVCKQRLSVVQKDRVRNGPPLTSASVRVRDADRGRCLCHHYADFVEVREARQVCPLS